MNKNKIKIKKEQKINENKYKCPICGKIYLKYGICSHIWRVHTKEGKEFSKKLSYPAWNKGLTKETDERVRKIGERYRENLRYDKIKHPWIGRQHKEITKKKISESMKKAHKEGRAWNIGFLRWKFRRPSYPEQFFMKVIQNEFNNKNYFYEFPFNKYSLDFAWPESKKYIEIDGEQHDRFEEYKERDRRKDDALKKEGWTILRIKWKDMVKNTKFYIKLAKQFIDE